MFLLVLVCQNHNHSNGQFAFDIDCQMKPVTQVFAFDCFSNPCFRIAIACAVVKVSSTVRFDEG